jgi:hypothetical protein
LGEPGEDAASAVNATLSTGQRRCNAPIIEWSGNTNGETIGATNSEVLVLTIRDVACPVSRDVFHGAGHWK